MTAPILATLVNVAGPDGFILLFLLIPLIFKIMMIIDCAVNESSQGNDKLVWLLITIFVPLGWIIYFFVRKLPRGKRIA